MANLRDILDYVYLRSSKINRVSKMVKEVSKHSSQKQNADIMQVGKDPILLFARENSTITVLLLQHYSIVQIALVKVV